MWVSYNKSAASNGGRHDYDAAHQVTIRLAKPDAEAAPKVTLVDGFYSSEEILERVWAYREEQLYPCKSPRL